MGVNTEILNIKGDWEEVVNDCRATVGKGELGHEPSEKFKKSILIAEHSPIRDIRIRWFWKDIESWVATHWSRHKWECFIKTQRTDRTGVSRNELPQDAPVNFTGEANVQNLIDTMRKRLCFQASKETRQCAEDLKVNLHEIEPEISDVLVPNCVYRCGCPEQVECPVKFWENAMLQTNGRITSTDIQDRYNVYNRLFWRNRKRGENNEN